MDSKSYWPAGDIIRVLAILGVIFVHLTQTTLRDPNQLSLQWWFLSIAQSCGIWAVPGFIMISGALLLKSDGKKERSVTFYQKRLNRIGLPFLFWVAVYIPFEKWYVSLSFAHLGKKFLYGNVSDHLYFLFVIAGLYVITPWLKSWLNKASSQQKLMLCIFLFILSATGKLLNEFGMIPLTLDLNALIRWIPYLSYYIAGYYIVYYAFDKVVLYSLLSIVGILATTGGKYLEMLLNANGVIYFYSTNYFSINVISLAIGIFGLIISLTRSISEDSKLVKICRFLAPTTFGIYLIHPMFLKTVHKLFNIQFPHHITIAFFHEIVIFLACILLVYIIGLIPLFRSVISYNTQKSLTKLFPETLN